MYNEKRNRNKKTIYRSFVTNSYNNITAGSSFNSLIKSSIVHPAAVLICPFIAFVPSTRFGDFQWRSPFDTGHVSTHIGTHIGTHVGTHIDTRRHEIAI